MLKREFWITLFHLFFLIKELLRKNSSYDLECLHNSISDCIYDLFSLRHHNCWYWQVEENEQDRNE